MMRPWLLAALAIVAASIGAHADEDSINAGLLTSAREVHATARPYFVGWDAEVTPASGLFQSTNEYGGLAIDLRGESIYVGTRDGFLVCLGPGGKVRWRVALGGEVLAPPTVYEQFVLVGTDQGVLHIINKLTGARVARGILGEQLITKPEVIKFASGAETVFVGSGAESLFAVDLTTGEKLWRAHRDIPTGFMVYGFARPVVFQKAVFIGYADGFVEARDPTTGALKWERHLSPSANMQDVDALGTNGHTIFAASYSGGVYALDPETGSVEWRHHLPRANRLRVDGPTLYAGAPGTWQALNTGNGSALWTFHLDGDLGSSETVVGDRYLAFSVTGGSLYFVDKLTGRAAGVFNSGEGFNSPPAAAGPAMAVLSNGGRVYSLTMVPP